jgi:hypothetical protein
MDYESESGEYGERRTLRVEDIDSKVHLPENTIRRGREKQRRLENIFGPLL